MKLKRFITAILVSTAVLVSCQREHLYYSATNCATVKIGVDWSGTGLAPNGLSVFAYNEDGSLYRRFDPFSDPTTAYVSLPTGKFNLVLMNDTPEEFAATMDFKGMDRFDTFRACSVESRANEFIVSPDTLAVSVIRDVVVTPDMIDYFYEKPSDFVDENTAAILSSAPRNVISNVNIRAHVKGLQYAKGTTISYLRGVSGGFYLGEEKNTDELVSHAFILNNRKFDEGSTTDGVISASFSTFGLAGPGVNDPRYYLEINFVLINGESYPLRYDVTDMIDVSVELSLQFQLSLNLEIELPEAIGEDEGDDGSFSTNVNQWVDIIEDVTM